MKQVTLMDSTLRDGANIVGKGFSAELTELILDGLTGCRVPIIELGNAGGIGAYEVAGFTQAETDETYLELAKKYLKCGSKIGMFLNAKRFREKSVFLAKESGLCFLRVGADAGDEASVFHPIKQIKKANLQAYYSVMKAYLLTPDELCEKAKELEAAGLDEITIMDSAGTMLPDEVARYTEKLKNALRIPVGFHGHNNLGLSAANAVAAYENGIDILDCGLMGMARSAGNLPTEVCVAMMRRMGQMQEIDFFRLLKFIASELQPKMETYHYYNPIDPKDLILGYSGMHSSFMKLFHEIAEEVHVDLFHLIAETALKNKKNPSKGEIRNIAVRLSEKEYCEE